MANEVTATIVIDVTDLLLDLGAVPLPAGVAVLAVAGRVHALHRPVVDVAL